MAVVGGLQRIGEMRTLLVDHLNDHAHSLGDDEDVGEDDGSIEQTGEALNRLQRQGRGDLGIATAFEEIAVAFGFVVLGEVAASFAVVSQAGI